LNDNYNPAILESNENERWELDTKPLLDRIFHDLLGEVEIDGTWQRDIKRRRSMNELGASEFISDVGPLFNIHSQQSVLEEFDILDIASRTAEDYADKLEDHWREWEVEPTQSNMESIGNRMFNLAFIGLRIARDGGMMELRANRNRPIIPPQKEAEGIL